MHGFEPALLRKLFVIAWAASALWPVAAAGPDAARRAESARLRELLSTAEAARNAGDLAAAERAFGAALETAEGFGSRTLHVARAADGLADVYRRGGRYDAAIPLYLRAIPLWPEVLTNDATGEAMPTTAKPWLEAEAEAKLLMR